MFLVFFYQGELINNIEKNVTSAAEYVDMSKAETCKAVAYKKNPYKVASLPSFLKPFKRKTTAKTATDQNTSDLNQDWAPEPFEHWLHQRSSSTSKPELDGKHFSSDSWYSACLPLQMPSFQRIMRKLLFLTFEFELLS